VRPRRHGALLRGPSTSPLDNPAQNAPMSVNFYLCVGAVALLNGTVAGFCARARAYRIYVGMLVLVAVALCLYLSLPFAQHVTPRHVVANILWTAPIPVLFGLSPGLWVRKGSTFAWTFLAGLLTTVLAAPVSIFYALILSCSVIGDCP